MAKKIIRIGKRVKGGNQMVRVDIDGVELEVELDPKKFSQPVIEAINKETERRIKAINEAPKPATVERRGPGGLFNVTGRLRQTYYRFVDSGWQLHVGRNLPRAVMNRLRAIGKINLQAILKVKAVQEALNHDLVRAMVSMKPAPPGKKRAKK